MALSGIVNSTAYSGRYLEFAWKATQSIENNESTITWTLYGRGTGGSGYYKTAPVTVRLDGNTIVNITERFELWNGTKVASGTTKLSHNNSTGAKSFTVNINAAIYTATANCAGSKTFTLDTIPRKATVISAPNFNDTDNPTITYQNLAGNNVERLQACISLTGASSDIAYRDISKTGTSYTFNLTDAERAVLLKNTTGANSRTVRFYIATTIDGSIQRHYLTKTFTVTDALPTLAPTVKDVGSVSTTLTGDSDNKVIKGYNYMSVATGATAYKEATITSQKITCGSKSITTATGSMSGVESGDFVITATDSRGNTVTQTIKKTLINYIDPTIHLKVGLPNAEGETSLSINGNCFIGSFGLVDNAVSLEYRCKSEDDTDYGAWIAVEAPKSSNSYTVNVSITGLDYQKAYTFQARVIDTIFSGGVNSKEITVKAIPVFDWSKEDFNFNVPLHYQEKPMDFVVEYGETDGWTWRKWYSGKAECWMKLEHKTALTNTWGTFGVGERTERQNYPFAFKEAPLETVSLMSAIGAVWIYAESAGNGVNSATQSACYNFARPNAVTTEQTFYISFYVVGEY